MFVGCFEDVPGIGDAVAVVVALVVVHPIVDGGAQRSWIRAGHPQPIIFLAAAVGGAGGIPGLASRERRGRRRKQAGTVEVVPHPIGRHIGIRPLRQAGNAGRHAGKAIEAGGQHHRAVEQVAARAVRERDRILEGGPGRAVETAVVADVEIGTGAARKTLHQQEGFRIVGDGFGAERRGGPESRTIGGADRQGEQNLAGIGVRVEDQHVVGGVTGFDGAPNLDEFVGVGPQVVDHHLIEDRGQGLQRRCQEPEDNNRRQEEDRQGGGAGFAKEHVASPAEGLVARAERPSSGLELFAKL